MSIMSVCQGGKMATIICNNPGRRMILLSTDDVISIVREYQLITYNKKSYTDIRGALDSSNLYIPEEIN